MVTYPHASLVSSAGEIAQLIFAGNTRLTVVNKCTGARHTYRIRQAYDANRWFVSVMAMIDNEPAERDPVPDPTHQFQYLGFYQQVGIVHVYSHGTGARVSQDHPSSIVWQELTTCILENRHLPGNLEIWHEERCSKCGSTLADCDLVYPDY